MNSLRLLALVTLTAIGASTVGCGGGVSLGNASGALTVDGDGDGDAGGSGGAATGPYDITCETYYSPGTTDIAEPFTFKSNADAQKTISFPGHTIDIAFAGSAETPSERTLSVAVREYKTVQRYRLQRDVQPINQLAGGHGFSGLVYVGAIQYICKAGDSPFRPSGTAPASFDVACTVELRTTPGGAIERSEILAFSTAKKQSLEFGELKLQATFSDSEYDGRSLVVSTSKSEDTSAAFISQHLFQFDRTVPIVNQLAGNSFTGRSSIVDGTNRELSYDCTSR